MHFPLSWAARACGVDGKLANGIVSFAGRHQWCVRTPATLDPKIRAVWQQGGGRPLVTAVRQRLRSDARIAGIVEIHHIQPGDLGIKRYFHE
jgi:hypothetical protein